MSTKQEKGKGLRTITLPGGQEIPVLGVGTWGMAERADHRPDEIAALRMAVDSGMTVVDTAEMYAAGDAEALVAEAIGDRRREIFLVSKVLPQHATRRGTVSACEASLRRLNTDHLDLYLLHWRGAVPLGETLAAFETLQRQGKIRHWGVSNFDVDDMEELASLIANADSIVASNRVLYNLTRRGIEYDLLPWCRTRRIAMMAYSPLERGRLAKDKTVQAMATRLDATPAQIALAWVLRQPGLVAIPKAADVEHVRENRGALEIELSSEDLDELDEVFPPPTHKRPLEMI